MPEPAPQPEIVEIVPSTKAKNLRRFLLWSALVLVTLFLCMALTLHGIERSFLYHPQKTYLVPGDAHAHAAFGEIGVTNERRENQYGWYVKPTTKKLTLVFFHDGADTINTIEHVFDSFIDQGYGVLLVEYRGYGDTPGAPSEENLYVDTENFFDFLHEVGTKDQEMVLIGQGVGAAVATEMATRHKVASLILISPFTSTQDFLKQKTFLRSLPFLLQDRYDNLSKIKKIQDAALLVMAGAKDTLIDPQNSKALYDAALPPKAFYTFKDGHHFDLFGPTFTKEVATFITPIDTGLENQAQKKLKLNQPMPPVLDLMSNPILQPSTPPPPAAQSEPQPIPGGMAAPPTNNQAPDQEGTP